MSITVPTAEIRVLARPDRRHWPTLGTLAALLLAWPVVALGSAAQPEPPPPPVAVVRPPTASAGAWVPSALGSGETTVAGLGSAVVAVDADGIWPVRLLRDGEWRRLLGMPLGVQVAPGVGTAVSDGFVVAGVEAGRTVLFRYDTAGRFLGATTLFDVEAGVLATVEGETVVFDVSAARAVVVGSGLIALPGTVVDVAVGAGLTILTADGLVHHSTDRGASWNPLAEGYVALVGVDPVYAVGATASVGLARITAGRSVDRLDGAPAGPTVTWDDRPAVYDWSTDSVWTLSETGWERIPLWQSDGFVGAFVSLIDGASVPSVLGVTERGPAVWQRQG